VILGGDLLELVEEEANRYTVPAQDISSLVNTILRFFELTSEKHEAMVTASKALGQERFAWSAIARKHAMLYQSLVESGFLNIRDGPTRRARRIRVAALIVSLFCSQLSHQANL
jgi:hypothetical protein